MSHSQLYIAFIISIVLLLSFSSNPPQGRTGGPGEQSCAAIGCHSGINVTIGGHIEMSGLPEPVLPDSLYNLTLDLIVDLGEPLRGGFQLMALTPDDENVGGFFNPGESATISVGNGRTYFEHDPAKRFEGKDTISYLFDWKISEELQTDRVIFYAAANFANGDGGSSSDRIVTWNDTFAIRNNSLTINTSLIQPSCNNTADGSITLLTSGGTPPYSYIWSNGDTTHLSDELFAADYTVTISDSGIISDTVMVTLEAKPDTTKPKIVCVADTLIISSCAPFSYPRPTALDECSEADVTLVSGKGTNQSFEPGMHSAVYEARDLSGNVSLCTIIINNINIIEAEVSVNDIACHNDLTGSADVMVKGENGPFEIAVLNDPSNIDSLPEGFHTIVITDKTGCQRIEEIEVRRPDSLELIVVEMMHPIDGSSGDGSISIDVSGGTPPYSFQWRTEDEDFSEDQNLTRLFPGNYHVIVSDINGCTIQSDTLTLDAITSVINSPLSEMIIISPNPTKDFLKIVFTEPYNLSKTDIIDIRGKSYGNMGAYPDLLDVRHLKSGTYFMIIEIEDGRKGMARFIKI